MTFAPQYREPASALPSIIVPSSDHFRNHGSHHDTPYGTTPAMSIPGLEAQSNVPPPLPPPRYLPGTEPVHHRPDDMRESYDYRRGHSSSSFASNYGSMASSTSYREDRPSYLSRNPTHIKTERDEGYESYCTDRSHDSLPPATGFGLHHNRFQFQSPADVDVDSMKKRLDRSLDKSPPRSLLSASANELLSCRPKTERQFPPALSVPVPVQLPIRGILGSPARFTETPLHSAISPHSGQYPFSDRCLREGSEPDHSPQSRTRRINSDDATSTHGSYDYSGADDMEIEETQSLKRLHIDDAYMAGSQKRRAASPSEEFHAQLDTVRRRELGSRGSPTPRLSTIPQGASISSISTSRSNSYMSTMSMPPSTVTSASSYGRRSPSGFSPGGISPTSCNSPHNAPSSLNPSPRTSISGRGSLHTRTVSGASPRKVPEVQKPSGCKLQSVHMCECCPKKPKRFETKEELNAHEAEKQYECSFCGNRFKNKNEAERHQNSLHVRRHSWSCSALSGYSRAFHESTNRSGEADICGYCGDEFPRSGRAPGSGAPRQATNEDWEKRIRHLQEVHKFRECNASKKFYRADHFRQHLKHSHAGTSGKWTNLLENACMMDEDPTPR